MSVPRGNGKSTLAAWLVSRCLTPGDPLHVPGAEYHLCASSIGQVRRTTWRLLREFVGNDPAYKWAESRSEVAVHHRPSGTRCSVLASSGKTSQGLVRCPRLIADEPGSWEAAGGQAMWDSIVEAQGKPGCDLRVIIIGTLAPALSGWWHELIEAGTQGDVYVQALQADPEKWDRASEIRRCNPLMWRYPASRKMLLERRAKARSNAHAKARFLSFRLNVPTISEAEVIFTPDDMRAIFDRSVPAPSGRPVVGLDAGSNRSWSMASIIWRSGRCDAVGVIPGVPDVAAQERRDSKPPGFYARLVAGDRLAVEAGRQVVEISTIIDRIMAFGPEVIVCDHHRLPAVQDAVAGRVPIEVRRRRWSESTDDIQATRRLGKDGNLAIVPEARALYMASLGDSLVVDDDFGSVSLRKRDSFNLRSRDDLAQALVLAGGAISRMPEPTPYRVRVVGQ